MQDYSIIWWRQPEVKHTLKEQRPTWTLHAKMSCILQQYFERNPFGHLRQKRPFRGHMWCLPSLFQSSVLCVLFVPYVYIAMDCNVLSVWPCIFNIHTSRTTDIGGGCGGGGGIGNNFKLARCNLSRKFNTTGVIRQLEGIRASSSPFGVPWHHSIPLI